MGRWAAVVSLVRNLSYMVFVARMVNILHQSGNYWLANNFIWKWLLLLFVPLAELLKQEVSCRPRVPSAHFPLLPAYALLSSLLFVSWLLSMPAWPAFFHMVLNVQDPAQALKIVGWLLPFYFFYMLATILDSIFYGFGLTDQLALVSLVSNVGFYGSAFLVYSIGVVDVNLEAVMRLFGSGMLVGSLVRLVLYYRCFLRVVTRPQRS